MKKRGMKAENMLERIVVAAVDELVDGALDAGRLSKRLAAYHGIDVSPKRLSMILRTRGADRVKSRAPRDGEIWGAVYPTKNLLIYYTGCDD